MDKLNRKEMSEKLRKTMSVYEIVVDTVVELTGHRQEKVEEVLIKTNSYKKLFDLDSTYYTEYIEKIAEDFMEEYNSLNE